MKRRGSNVAHRGTTLVEVLVAVFLITLIFIFITAELIQTSQAENLASNHSETIAAANYLLGVMKGDGTFWNAGEWASGNGQTDGCGVSYPPYTDSITAPTWHKLCGTTFPEIAGQPVALPSTKVGNGVNAQYMWNSQIQGGDKNVAQLTIWVMTDEGGRNDVYELHGTRMQTAPTPNYSGVFPSPSPTSTPSSPPPSTPPPSGTPTPKPSPTATPTKTPKPSPTPTGIFE